MATSKQKPKIDPQAIYRVDLSHSIKVGRTAIHPGPNVKLRGDVVSSLADSDPDAVISFEPAKTI